LIELIFKISTNKLQFFKTEHHIIFLQIFLMSKPNNNTYSLVKDLSASIVVFLVALPLCLGVALASGAPLFSGIIAGIIGGVVTGLLSGSQLSVSGPAAGLTVIVASAISTLPNYQYFLVSVVLSGFLQIIFGLLKAGIIGNFFPNSVIKGMLSAIGIILILKQLPHALGYDNDVEGDEEFIQSDGHNTFSEFFDLFENLTLGCIIISLCTAIVLILWDTKWIKSSFLKITPGALIAVLSGTLLSYFYNHFDTTLKLESKHLVNLPISNSFSSFTSNFMLPDFTNGLQSSKVWITAITISIVASLESLLSIEATDKLDPQKRITPLNRELFAQGAGNILSGSIGGIPITAVIVRSSANILGGAQTKLSAILHGLLLLISVMFIPALLNSIPLATLAVILIFTGYKLAKPSIFKEIYKKGWDSFIPFIVTIVAILFSDLLKGIAIGMFVGIIFVFRSNIKLAILVTTDQNNYLLRFIKDVTFFNKSFIRNFLRNIPKGSTVIIDMRKPVFVDDDIKEVIEEFKITAETQNIKLEILEDVNHNNFNNTKIN
jgi:MFS superfamily sulfate permease-like transporter